MTIMIIARKILAAIALFCIALIVAIPAQPQGCFSVVVGKEASADGYVILGHNEDDSPPQVVNHHKVPRGLRPGVTVKLQGGGELDEEDQTWAYIWSEMPGMRFSDSYVNEWGVAIASDACPSREDQPELTEGGISYNLRKIVAQRAKNAREGVLIAGELVERFSYDSSGRTYMICDPEEGWLFCAVNGKHWLARRVPDDEVALIANTYTVHEVDLSDTDSYLACDDIIDYAAGRGWYDPEVDQSFDFAAAYADPEIASDSSNFCRQWSGLRYVSDEPMPLQVDLPFSIKPKEKLGVADVMQILRDHYEGTELYQASPQTGSPHHNRIATICNRNTQTSFVVQLRGDMPPDIGIVYWVCLGNPCTSIYIPWHFGGYLPKGYYRREPKPVEEVYWEKVAGPLQINPFEAFWTFSNFSHKADSLYSRNDMSMFRRVEIGILERRAFEMQESIERAALELYVKGDKGRADAGHLLTNFSHGLYLNALEFFEGAGAHVK